MQLPYEELKEHILKEYDVDLLCEALEITSEELLDAFESRVLQNVEKFSELGQDFYETEN